MADLKENFPIDPRTVSVRLFFAKDSELSNLWHLCDAALGTYETGEGVMYTALHGARMYVVVRADTVLQADLKRGLTDGICQRCLQEFMLAADLIREKRLLKFQ